MHELLRGTGLRKLYPSSLDGFNAGIPELPLVLILGLLPFRQCKRTLILREGRASTSAYMDWSLCTVACCFAIFDHVPPWEQHFLDLAPQGAFLEELSELILKRFLFWEFKTGGCLSFVRRACRNDVWIGGWLKCNASLFCRRILCWWNRVAPVVEFLRLDLCCVCRENEATVQCNDASPKAIQNCLFPDY